ncbi:hypothetical protein GMDG_03934 [Pseudogymnoascus destructans 20631-21]|uniref:Uncharacterized protein n=1 Tax=Pseudogymnoascus destructans (strain ATCC MYA-4855 / 20631-21) TaxID=658429 RepID=L8G9P1_PSED2|nr:hypothetical protein GMDG_03934 [Pseudogymnoascus destructans 20631-21]
MTSFSTDPTASPRRLPLLATTPNRTYVVSYLLIHILLCDNICILYYKCTSFTDTSLFSPAAFAKGFIGCSKGTYLSGQKGVLMC